MNTAVKLDVEPIADGGFMVRCLLACEGQVHGSESRPRLNISLVLDRSGSMEGEKLEAARDAACLLVRRLSPEDLVSVVAYDNVVRVIAPPATGEQQEDLLRRISSLRAGATTNLSGGWLQGRDFIAENLTQSGVNRIILLTDGLANLGITDPSQLTGMCLRAFKEGITTTTVGLGEGYDEKLLSSMADAGGGNTYYVERPDQAGGIFAQELEGLLTLSAQNLTVRVTPGDDADFLRVLHTYPSREAGDSLILSVGDLYPREPRRVLAEFLIQPEVFEARGEDAVAEVARFSVTAHVLTEEGDVERQEIDIPVTLTAAEGGRADPEVRKEMIFIVAADAREKALQAREKGDLADAVSHLRLASHQLQAAGLDDAEVQEEIADLQNVADHIEVHGMHESDAKYLYQRSHDSRRSTRSSLLRYRREAEAAEAAEAPEEAEDRQETDTPDDPGA